MGAEEEIQKKEKETLNILLEGVPYYLYDQIKTASEQMDQTIREWIIGACHMRYTNQFRDNLLNAGKGRSGGGGSWSPVV
jgi:hypothetical protein